VAREAQVQSKAREFLVVIQSLAPLHLLAVVLVRQVQPQAQEVGEAVAVQVIQQPLELDLEILHL
jgi:hypothetical protein